MLPSRLPRAAAAGAVILAVLALAALPAGAAQHEMTLTQVSRGQSMEYRESIRETTSGFEAVVESPRERNVVALDPGRDTESWRISVPAEGMQIAAERRGATVTISGTFRGAPYNRSFSLGDDPWYQFQELSLDGLPATGERAIGFWTIDRRNLKPVRFRAERRHQEMVDVMGTTVQAVRYDMIAAGVPAGLFRARFWLRASDGRYLRLEVPAFLGEASSAVELTADSDW
jgi:hypothetical protein